MATVQAKRAISALLAAGYKRNEFQVHTKIRRVGFRGYEYGNAEIVVWADREKQLELVPKVVEQGIRVSIPKIKGKILLPHYYTDGKPGVEILDFDEI